VTAFADLTQQIATILTGSTPIAGGNIFTGRAFGLQEDQQQAVFVHLVRGTGASPFANDTRTDWTTEIAVVCLSRALNDQDGDAAVDWLLGEAYARLAAATPPPDADGWVIDPTVLWYVDEMDQTVCAAELRIRIQQRTGSGVLTAAA
jgi:hypothetical protein